MRPPDPGPPGVAPLTEPPPHPAPPPGGSRPPIVVLGANHTGTRLVVELLEALGSDGGRSDNPFREERTFLELHEELIGRVGHGGWLATIFDPGFASSFVDDGGHESLVRDRLVSRYGPALAPDHGGAWHWKCPTSLYFLPTWLRVFPAARFIHVERDPVEVAASFLRRGEVRRVSEGVALYHAMNGRILSSSPRMSRYHRLRLESIGEELEGLALAAGLTPSSRQLSEARAKIRKPGGGLWSSRRTGGENVREGLRRLRCAAYRWTGLSWL